MLYDALAVPNIGLEYYVGKNLSVSGEWMYAWWGSPRRHHLWRIYGGDAGLRYRFGSPRGSGPLAGHHIGVYAGILTFDFQLGGKGYMGGRPGHGLWDRFIVNAGIEYGYSLPVASRVNIDFSLGIGYLGGIMEKYEPRDERNVWKSTVRKTWIGPSKAEISVVWLIGHGNRNSRKGRGRKDD